MATLENFTPRATKPQPLTSMRLKELVCPVHGFHVHVDTQGVLQIINVTDESAIDDPAYKVGCDTRFFWLMDGEHVVEVSYTVEDVHNVIGPSGVYCSSTRVTAIRFQTNVRGSQWFGVPKGCEVACAADDGKRIHAISVQRAGGYCTKLHAVVLPLTTTQAGIPKVRIHQVITSQETGKAFSSCSGNVRAVFVDLNTLSITVLSTEEFDRFVDLQGGVQFHSSDHVEELIPGEKILRVDYTATSKIKTLCAFRLVTTHRTTPWFGNPRLGERLSFTTGETEGAYICDFTGIVSDNRVVALGVMVTTPKSS